MSVNNFKKRYRDLATEVISSLRDAIANSPTESKHVAGKAISVELEDYTELVVVHDRVSFLDENGYAYNAISADLEDLIDILEGAQ